MAMLATKLLCFVRGHRSAGPVFLKRLHNLKLSELGVSKGPQLANVPGHNIAAMQVKKRPVRKKKLTEEGPGTAADRSPGMFNVVAFSTAEEYNLEALLGGLKQQDLYVPRVIEKADAVHATAKYQVDAEPRDIFFFRTGGVVLWNVTDLESSNVLSFLRRFEKKSYTESLITEENEVMNYHPVDEEGRKSALDDDGNFSIASGTGDAENTLLVKYTFSNAMAQSVKLGIYEAMLDKFIDSIEAVTSDLKAGNKIKMTQGQVLQKHGELMSLRHRSTLRSDLLNRPDFYWDRDNLEALFDQTALYFDMEKRTKVMNIKIEHCIDLIELLQSHLSDKHHVRLEWMIIILIMVEVGFEMIHFADRLMA